MHLFLCFSILFTSPCCYSSEVVRKEQGLSLLKAAFQGGANRLEELLRNNSYVDVKTKKGQTPLMIAAVRGNQMIVKRLLKYLNQFNFDPEIDFQDSDRNTALIYACENYSRTRRSRDNIYQSLKKCGVFSSLTEMNISLGCLNESLTREQFLDSFSNLTEDASERPSVEKRIRDLEIISTLLNVGADYTIKSNTNYTINTCIDFITLGRKDEENFEENYLILVYALRKMNSIVQDRWNLTALLLKENGYSDDLISSFFSFYIDEENDQLGIDKKAYCTLPKKECTKLIDCQFDHQSKFEHENDQMGCDLIELDFNFFKDYLASYQTKEEYF